MRGTINRREFLKTAAFACPVLAGTAGVLRGAQQKKPEVTGLAVLKEKCTGCGDCVKICPVEAIKLKSGLAVIDNEECLDCGACLDECPTEAIVHKKDLPEGKAAAKAEPAKPDPARGIAAGAVDLGGLWTMTGTFTDGAVSSDVIRFAGSASAGTIRSAETNEEQGAFKIVNGQVEIRLPDGQIAKGRVVSPDRMEGSLPGGIGTWRAERKK